MRGIVCHSSCQEHRQSDFRKDGDLSNFDLRGLHCVQSPGFGSVVSALGLCHRGYPLNGRVIGIWSPVLRNTCSSLQVSVDNFHYSYHTDLSLAYINVVSLALQ